MSENELFWGWDDVKAQSVEFWGWSEYGEIYPVSGTCAIVSTCSNPNVNMHAIASGKCDIVSGASHPRVGLAAFVSGICSIISACSHPRINLHAAIRRPPSLTRVSTGQIFDDDFAVDSSSNYQGYGETISWSPGRLLLSAVANPYVVMHKLAASVMCLTMHGQTGGGYFATPLLAVYPTYDPIENRDGYYHRVYGTQMRLYKYVNMNATTLAEAFAASSADPWWSRLYKSSDTLIGRGGGSTLGNVVSVELAEPKYQGPFYAAERCNTVRWIDRWAAHTSHVMTCSGLADGQYVDATDGTTDATPVAAVAGSASVDCGTLLFGTAGFKFRVYDGDPAAGGTLVLEYTNAQALLDGLVDTLGKPASLGGGDQFQCVASGTSGVCSILFTCSLSAFEAIRAVRGLVSRGRVRGLDDAGKVRGLVSRGRSRGLDSTRRVRGLVSRGRNRGLISK